jgi:hypothetical protein
VRTTAITGGTKPMPSMVMRDSLLIVTPVIAIAAL